MCSYNRSEAASQAKCMFSVKMVHFPREFRMFFSAFESGFLTPGCELTLQIQWNGPGGTSIKRRGGARTGLW